MTPTSTTNKENKMSGNFMTIRFPVEVTMEADSLCGMDMEEAKKKVIEACLNHLGFHDYTYSDLCSVEMVDIDNATMENWSL
jgi:hypothetical protein